MGSGFDLRYALVIVLNLVKSLLSSPSPGDNWDPFEILLLTPPRNWILLTLLLLTSLVFSVVSVTLSLNTPSPPLLRILVWFNDSFSIPMMISFLAALFLPQVVFWYFYPVFLILSCIPISVTFKSLVPSLKAILSTAVLGFDIHITRSAPDVDDPEVNLDKIVTHVQDPHEAAAS